MRYCNIQHASRAMVCAILLGFVGTGSADEITGSNSVAEELLEILRAAGTIDEAQYSDLHERAREEEALRAKAANAAPSAEADPEDWKFNWSNGFNLQRNDGAFKLKFGGRIQNDWAFVELSESLQNTIGGEGHGTEFRRAWLYFSGTVYERAVFKIRYSFSNTGDGEVDLKEAYIGLKDLGPIDTVLVGHMKEPFSLDERTGSNYLTFMERALPNVFAASRNTGFAADGTAADKRFFWQAGAFMDSNSSGFSFDNDGKWNLSGRLVGVPLYENDGEKVVHLGFGYSHQFRGGNDFMLRYRQRPESHLAPRLVDTGSTIPTNHVNLINPEVAVVWGPASFQAEYMNSFVSGDDGTKNTSFWSAYAQLSYFLTGEHRNYKLGKGSFSRVKPKANFNPAEGNWGAFEVGVRYSYLDLNDEFVRGGKMWDITAGINWHLFPNTRVSLNYVHSELDNRLISPDPDVDGNADIVQARFQLDF